MSTKQLNRFDILSKANDGYITVREASEALGISARQVKRLKTLLYVEAMRKEHYLRRGPR